MNFILSHVLRVLKLFIRLGNELSSISLGVGPISCSHATFNTNYHIRFRLSRVTQYIYCLGLYSSFPFHCYLGLYRPFQFHRYYGPVSRSYITWHRPHILRLAHLSLVQPWNIPAAPFYPRFEFLVWIGTPKMLSALGKAGRVQTASEKILGTQTLRPCIRQFLRHLRWPCFIFTEKLMRNNMARLNFIFKWAR